MVETSDITSYPLLGHRLGNRDEVTDFFWWFEGQCHVFVISHLIFRRRAVSSMAFCIDQSWKLHTSRDHTILMYDDRWSESIRRHGGNLPLSASRTKSQTDFSGTSILSMKKVDPDQDIKNAQTQSRIISVRSVLMSECACIYSFWHPFLWSSRSSSFIFLSGWWIKVRSPMF